MPGIDTSSSSMEESPAGRIYTMEHYRSSESLEDRHSNASSTESSRQILDNYVRKDHEFIPTRMKAITASKPAANPGQFTKIPSNPLLLSAQSQMMKVEQVKRTKEIVRKTEEEPDWQSNLNVWKDRRRKQSEDALLRVSEIKKSDDDPSMDSGLEQRKLSLGKKLSSLVHNDEDDDWLGPVTKNGFHTESQQHHYSSHRSVSTSSIPLPPSSTAPPAPPTVSNSMKEHTRSEPRRKNSPKRSRSTGVLMSSEEIKQTTEAAQLQSQPLRRKSSELSTAMKSRLEAFETTSSESTLAAEAAKKSSVAPVDETFRQKLESFKEKEIEKEEEAKYVPPKKSITDFLDTPDIHNSLGSGGGSGSANKSEEEDDDVDKLLDDALEESYRSVLENEEHSQHNLSNGSGKSVYSYEDFSPSSGPPKEKPPPPPLEPPPASTPPPTAPVSKKNLFFEDRSGDSKIFNETTKRPQMEDGTEEDEEIDKQERDIIASLEVEEKEHLKYMESMKNMSLNNSNSSHPFPSAMSGNSPSGSSTASKSIGKSSSHQTTKHSYDEKIESPKKKSQQQQHNHERNINNHWLIQEAEQRRLMEMQQNQHPRNTSSSSSSNLVSQNKTSPVHGGSYSRSNGPTYENSVDLRNSHNNKANLIHQSVVVQQQQQQIPNNNNNSVATTSTVSSSSSSGSSSSLHFSKQSLMAHQQQQQPIYNNFPPSGGNNSNHNSNIINNNNLSSYNYENTYANVQAQSQVHHSPPGHGDYPGTIRESNTSINTVVSNHTTNSNPRVPGPQVPPRNMENPDRMLSVSGKKKCSHCREELGRGAAMIIESLRLYYHLRCFQCCVCQIQLGNGTSGTDVRVRNNKLHCQNCYSNDEGLKFSKV